MSTPRSILVVAFALVSGLVAWGLFDQRPKPPARLINQVWLERVPEHERDLVTHLVMVPQQPREIGGVLGRSSAYRIGLETFMHKLNGDELTLFFPQDKEHARVKVRTWLCEGEAPEPFQLCLELSAGRRKLRMYSRDDWTVGDGAGVPLPEAALHVPRLEVDDDMDELDDEAQEELPSGLER